MSYVRWLMAYFVGLALIPGTPMLALFLDALIGHAVCPRSAIGSDVCRMSWSGPLRQLLFSGALAFGTAAFVALPTWAAPSHRRAVVKATFLLVLVFAGFAMLLETLNQFTTRGAANSWWLGMLPLIAPCIAGAALTRWLLLRQLPQGGS